MPQKRAKQPSTASVAGSFERPGLRALGCDGRLKIVRRLMSDIVFEGPNRPEPPARLGSATAPNTSLSVAREGEP